MRILLWQSLNRFLPSTQIFSRPQHINVDNITSSSYFCVFPVKENEEKYFCSLIYLNLGEQRIFLPLFYIYVGFSPMCDIEFHLFTLWTLYTILSLLNPLFSVSLTCIDTWEKGVKLITLRNTNVNWMNFPRNLKEIFLKWEKNLERLKEV